MPRQPFHLVEPSPWPITASMAALMTTLGIVLWFHQTLTMLMTLGTLAIMASMVQWWRDVIREATFMGFHTSQVQKGLRSGMMLFILSEVMFFFAFFWAFFHSSLAPTPMIGCLWPPTGITPINPFSVPLLNTALLLASGVTVTWAHHSLTSGAQKDTMIALMVTIALGIYFTILQAMEYVQAPFSIADSVYGSVFFVATGFHGAHVIIGTTFLLVCLTRAAMQQFSTSHHFGFEAASWYWHFVDVVWIMLFISIYWWGF